MKGRFLTLNEHMLQNYGSPINEAVPQWLVVGGVITAFIGLTWLGYKINAANMEKIRSIVDKHLTGAEINQINLLIAKDPQYTKLKRDVQRIQREMDSALSLVDMGETMANAAFGGSQDTQKGRETAVFTQGANKIAKHITISKYQENIDNIRSEMDERIQHILPSDLYDKLMSAQYELSKNGFKDIDIIKK